MCLYGLLPQVAPFSSIAALFDSVTPELAARANKAYNGGGTRLVWKDAHGEGRYANSCLGVHISPVLAAAPVWGLSCSKCMNVHHVIQQQVALEVCLTSKLCNDCMHIIL